MTGTGWIFSTTLWLASTRGSCPMKLVHGQSQQESVRHNHAFKLEGLGCTHPVLNHLQLHFFLQIEGCHSRNSRHSHNSRHDHKMRFPMSRPPLKLSEDLQPGQPCKDFIGAERYTGHFKRGVRHGIGISVTSCGTLMREAWRRQARPGRVKPQLLQRTPLFLYSEKSDKEKTSEERKRDKLRKIERSRISRILEWSVREVQFFSACLGIGPATQSKIDTHQIDGDAFLSIISPDSADLVKDLFPLEEGSKTGTSSCGIWPQRPDVSARHRILIATVDFFHRALHKLSEPQPTEKDLNDQFPSLNIPKADLQLTGYVGEGGFGRVYSGIYKGARVAAKSTEGTRESREEEGNPLHWPWTKAGAHILLERDFDLEEIATSKCSSFTGIQSTWPCHCHGVGPRPISTWCVAFPEEDHLSFDLSRVGFQVPGHCPCLKGDLQWNGIHPCPKYRPLWCENTKYPGVRSSTCPRCDILLGNMVMLVWGTSW